MKITLLIAKREGFADSLFHNADLFQQEERVCTFNEVDINRTDLEEGKLSEVWLRIWFNTAVKNYMKAAKETGEDIYYARLQRVTYKEKDMEVTWVNEGKIPPLYDETVKKLSNGRQFIWMSDLIN